MLFSSLTFLYYFLPATLVAYFLIPARHQRGRNTVLLVASLVFYAWGEPKYVLLMIAQCLSAWAFGLLIDKYRGQRAATVALIVSVTVTLSGLIIFKYANFLLTNLSALIRTELPLIALVMPIGISFYTFQIISYTADLYWGRIAVQRHPAALATYICLFPQLIAGPIVRYATVASALDQRDHSWGGFAAGMRRFTIGLGKKVLLANLFGELAGIARGADETSVLFTWLYLVAFALQIYFDFSGYSDMAIGLGLVLGFRFLENFNYPYIAGSVTDFWRRWHMSLSSWFRDYVYIPLGGNRVAPWRWALNVMVVWTLTGLWHGAQWNFMAWGAFFGVVLLAEKTVRAYRTVDTTHHEIVVFGRHRPPVTGLCRVFGRKTLHNPAWKAPGRTEGDLVMGSVMGTGGQRIIRGLKQVTRHVYVLIIVLVSWALFDAASLGDAVTVITRMAGVGADSLAGPDSAYYLRSYAVPLLIGLIGATPLPKLVTARLSARPGWATVLEPLLIGVVLVLSTAAIIDGSFNPFIYFRF